MLLLSRAEKLAELARQEFAKRQKSLEIDQTISKITLEYIIGQRSGDPVKIRFLTSSESDLIKAGSRVIALLSLLGTQVLL